MTRVPFRRWLRIVGAAALVPWLAGTGLAAQEPADTAAADSSVGVPPSPDSALQARLDSVRREERARRNAVVRSLRPGDRVRVRAGGRTVDGRFLRLADGRLFLRTPSAAGEEERSGEDVAPVEDAARTPRRSGTPLEGDTVAGTEVRPIPVDAMEALWIRLGKTGTGALWGGVLGAVGGAVGGYFINEALCNEAEDCIFDSADAAVVFGIGGGLAGIGFGALIGRSFKEWRQWYPEEGFRTGG